MNNQFEQPKISFTKHTGEEKQEGKRTAEVKVLSEISITHGGLGEIFDTEVYFGKHPSGKDIIRRFIVKKYFNTTFSSAEEGARNALEKYVLAKNCGLKVFRTFRIGEDGTSILMTAGSLDDKICIGSNSSINMVFLKQPLIKEIENMDAFLLDFFREQLKAAQQGIELFTDNFFFIISKKEPRTVDFVLGDLDNLKKVEHLKQIAFQNASCAENVLSNELSSKNLDPKLRSKFEDRVAFFHKKIREEIRKDDTLK